MKQAISLRLTIFGVLVGGAVPVLELTLSFLAIMEIRAYAGS